jgi:two-component system NtrC family response regulator
MAEGKWVSVADLGLADLEPSVWHRPTLQEARAELEQQLIREALARTGHNVQEAARQLGVSRMTLYRLLERYHVSAQRPAVKPTAAATPHRMVR